MALLCCLRFGPLEYPTTDDSPNPTVSRWSEWRESGQNGESPDRFPRLVQTASGSLFLLGRGISISSWGDFWTLLFSPPNVSKFSRHFLLSFPSCRLETAREHGDQRERECSVNSTMGYRLTRVSMKIRRKTHPERFPPAIQSLPCFIHHSQHAEGSNDLRKASKNIPTSSFTFRK